MGSIIKHPLRVARRSPASFWPALIGVLGLLLSIWAGSAWLLRETWRERDAAVRQLVDAAAVNARDQIARQIADIDRLLRDPRAAVSVSLTAGVARLGSEGQILAATPGARITGWRELMARVNAAPQDLAIGPASVADGGFLPLARRAPLTDSGLIMSGIDSARLFPMGPDTGLLAVSGCLALIADDGAVLATIGRGGPCAAIDLAEGDGRIAAIHRAGAFALTVIAAIPREAAFAAWTPIQTGITASAMFASVLVLATGFLTWRRQKRLIPAAEALLAVLAHIAEGVRITGRDGATIAANPMGLTLTIPPRNGGPSRARRDGDRLIQTERHALPGGGVLLIGTDRTVQSAADTRADFLARHDALTGLLNRRAATHAIEQRLALHDVDPDSLPPRVALILLDLDGFHAINTTLGHEAGDAILVEIAERLRDCLGRRDIIARFAGNEFLLCLDHLDVGADVGAAVEALTRALPIAIGRPIAIAGEQARLGVSMGVAFFPADGADAETLLRHADLALREAKTDCRGWVRAFNPVMEQALPRERMLESDLRRALDGNELELRFQPQFSSETLDVTGFEALARWHHPERGELSPELFIPIAEKSGLINAIGLWAIEEACGAAAFWHERHRVAVNISPSQLRSETIEADIRAILRKTQFPPHLLELEVTESVLLDEDERVLETLHRLRAMDIRVTLDDFGAGYSSLGYLRRFPFDKIKIDKSFVMGQSEDRGTRVILEAMIRMCSDLGFDVVAEGVETDQQLQDVRALGCQEIQGYLMSEPMRPEAVEAFLIRHGRSSGIGRARPDLYAQV